MKDIIQQLKRCGLCVESFFVVSDVVSAIINKQKIGKSCGTDNIQMEALV